MSLTLRLLDQQYALIQLPSGSPVPPWVQGRFSAVLNSTDEVTIVSEQSCVPSGLATKQDFRCYEIVGPFALESVGIVAAVTRSIADAGISLFAYSTWSTDFILVAGDQVERATGALRAAGHVVL